jgi:hypothetical protein
MNQSIRKFLTTSLLTASMVASSGAFALEGITSNTADGNAEINVNEIDAVTVSFSHPQSLSVSSPNNVANRAASSVINRTWHVVSNNAVTVKFTGRSPDAYGGLTNSPTFYKAEIGADGEQIGTQYDHLVTNFSASINNMEEGQGTLTGTPHWGGVNQDANEYGNTDGAATGYVTSDLNYFTEDGPKPFRIDQTTNLNALNDYIAYGTPEELVNVAGNYFGTIMPDDNGRFSMTLSSRGVGDVATTQSGDYQITVVASFIAAELGNYSTIAVDGYQTGYSANYDITGIPAEEIARLEQDLYDYRFDASDGDDNTSWSQFWGETDIIYKSATVYGDKVEVSVDYIAYYADDNCPTNATAGSFCGLTSGSDQ